MAKVITSKDKYQKQIIVKKTGHPATFRKMRCPACSVGYAVESNVEKGKYTCQRCGSSFTQAGL
jgi:transposase-like protein